MQTWQKSTTLANGEAKMHDNTALKTDIDQVESDESETINDVDAVVQSYRLLDERCDNILEKIRKRKSGKKK
jgi:hypothetical protein